MAGSKWWNWVSSRVTNYCKYLRIDLKNGKVSLDMLYLCHLEVIMILISCSVGMFRDSSICHDHVVAQICVINSQKVIIIKTQSEVQNVLYPCPEKAPNT